MTVLTIDPVHDLATLRIDDVAPIRPFLPHREPLHHLAPLSPVVYPGYLNGSIENLPLPLRFTRDLLMTSGNFVDNNGNNPFSISDVGLIQFQALAEHGMSGSAVVDTQSGEAIGVLEGSLTQGAGLAWAIPLQYLESKQTGVLTQPAITALITWPQLELVHSTTISALDSITLVTSFEPHLGQTQKDRESYQGLLATVDQTFDACFEGDKAWNHIAQSLPDGLLWPLSPGDIPDVSAFNQKYIAASKARQETCQKAKDLLRDINVIRERIKTDIALLTQDLEASKAAGPNTNISASLTKDLLDTTQSIAAKQQQADSLAKKANTAIEAANAVHLNPVTDTKGLKDAVYFLGAADIAMVSTDSRKSLQLSYEASTDFLNLLSETVSLLAAIPVE